MELVNTNRSVGEDTGSEIDALLYIPLILIRLPKQYSEKSRVFSTNGVGTGHPQGIRRNPDPYSLSHTKINIGWIIGLTIKVITIDLLGKKNIEEYLHDLRVRKGFLHGAQKTKFLKLDLTKI